MQHRSTADGSTEGIQPPRRSRASAKPALTCALRAWVVGLALLVASVESGCSRIRHSIDQGDDAWIKREWTNSLGMDFVWIPAGTFVMGSPGSEARWWGVERQHEVTISQGYWLGKYEVTQGEWEAVMGRNPAQFKGCGSRCPVETVSWDGAQSFIERLNQLESGSGYEYRLPTEAEWEYAARAGSKGATPEGDLQIVGGYSAPVLDGQAWYGADRGVTYAGGSDCPDWAEKADDAERCGTRVVGLNRANGWGLHDMLGNVYEWTADYYGEYPSGSVTDPTGPSAGSYRVIRGGSWYTNARHVRSAYRDSYPPGRRYDTLGFRLVRTK